MKKFINLFLLLFFITTLNLSALSNELSTNRRYVFIDGGAYNGRLYKSFETISSFSNRKWELYAIEANPYIIKNLPEAAGLTIIDNAIWINDGPIKFYVEAPPEQNISSLFKNLTNNSTEVTIEAIDFSQWIKKNFKKDDYIILNLDIGGAEYPVLEKMLHDGSTKYIDKLFVEFEEYTPKEATLMKKIRRLGTKTKSVSLWNLLVQDIIEKDQWEDMSE